MKTIIILSILFNASATLYYRTVCQQQTVDRYYFICVLFFSGLFNIVLTSGILLHLLFSIRKAFLTKQPIKNVL